MQKISKVNDEKGVWGERENGMHKLMELLCFLCILIIIFGSSNDFTYLLSIRFT